METMIQPKVTGYRKLSEAEVALMNEGKALAEQCGEYIAKLRQIADGLRPSAKQVETLEDCEKRSEKLNDWECGVVDSLQRQIAR